MGLGFITDVKPGCIAWSNKSDNMAATVGISATSGVINCALSLADAMQQAALEQKRTLVELLHQCVEVATRYQNDREVGDPQSRLLLQKYGGQLRHHLMVAKSGSYAQLRLSGNACLQDGGVVEEFLSKALGPALGAEHHVFLSLNQTLNRVKLLQGDLAEVFRKSLVIAGDQFDSAQSAAEALKQEALADASSLLSAEAYAQAINLAQDGRWVNPERIGRAGVLGLGLAALKSTSAVVALPVMILGQFVMIGVSSKAENFATSHEDGVSLLLLSRAGREFQAGLTGHRGCVVGEAGGGMNQLLDLGRRSARSIPQSHRQRQGVFG